MKPEILEKFIDANETLAPHKGYLNSLIKPSVDILFSNDVPRNHESRFGGVPLVSDGFAWPVHEEGEYRFLCQINFSEITDCPDALPQSGLLSLFYAYDEDGDIFWGDDGYVLGYFYPTINDLILYDQGSNVRTPKKIVFSNGIEIPRHEDLRNDWPFDTEALYELSALESYCENYLLGYPSFFTLGYDPTPSEEWVSLLTLTSYDEFECCWHDGNKLMVFIEKGALGKADFSHLKTDAG